MVSEIMKNTSAPDAAMHKLWPAATDSGEFPGRTRPEPKPHWNQWFPVSPGICNFAPPHAGVMKFGARNGAELAASKHERQPSW
jgi:hypothetical protein